MGSDSDNYSFNTKNARVGVVMANVVKECVEKVEKGYEAVFIYQVGKVPVLFSEIVETEGEAYEKLWEFKKKYIAVCDELEN